MPAFVSFFIIILKNIAYFNIFLLLMLNRLSKNDHHSFIIHSKHFLFCFIKELLILMFLKPFLEKLKAATAACIAAISSGNKKNQDALLEAGALE